MSRIKKKKKPRFTVMNEDHVKRIGHRWRKPRGIDNKKRVRFKFAGNSPRVGYGNSQKVKGLHPSGYHEVLVCNLSKLGAIKDNVVRIAASVGAKKRKMIEEKAKQMGLRILN